MLYRLLALVYPARLDTTHGYLNLDNIRELITLVIRPILYTWELAMELVRFVPGEVMPWSRRATRARCVYTTRLQTRAGAWPLEPIASKR